MNLVPLLGRRELLGGLGAWAVAAPIADARTSPPPSLPRVRPADPDLMPDRLALAGRLVADAVEKRGVPGAVLLVGRNGAVALHETYGAAGIGKDGKRRPMRSDTLFDLASLTKPFAAATALVRLIEAGRVGIDAPAADYLPALAAAGGDGARITVRHLLTHAGGLVAGGAFAGKRLTLAELTETIARSRQVSPPGTAFLYSDYSAVLWQSIVEAVTGTTLDAVCREQIWRPLGMTDTDYRPAGDRAARCAATVTGDDPPARRGLVHDPTAAALGGVSGNAGLFSTADDLARFCQTLLDGGAYRGVRVLNPETVETMTTRQSPFDGNDRGLGWDIASGYALRGDLSNRSFGHTGFTGTSVWIDPFAQTFVILLTNAVHAREAAARGHVIRMRRVLSSVVASAVPQLALPDPERKVAAFLASPESRPV